ACHSARNLKEVEVSGGLALDSYEAVVGNKGKHVIHRGKSADSALYQRLVTKDEELRMPQGAKALAPEQVALLKRWIDLGAPEGKRPDDSTVVSAPAGRRRKLDVLFNTSAVPPPGALGQGKPAALQLCLKVGPLAPVTAVTFSPDGKRLAVGSYGQ